MSAESDLYAALSTDAPLVALVSTRVYPDLVPVDAALPAVGFMRTDTEFISTIHSAAPVAEDVSIECYCMADTRAQAESVANAVVAAAATVGFYPTGRQMIPPEDEEAVIGTAVTLERMTKL